MQRAVNSKTGEVLFLVNNQWTPPSQVAKNPKTGQMAYLVNNQWQIDPQEKEEESGDVFVPALKSGFSGVQEAGYALAGRTGLMDEAAAQKAIEEEQAYQQRVFKPTEEGFLEAPVTKTLELLGQSLPFMALPVAAAGAALTLPVTGTAATVAGLGAAGLASGAQFTGTNLLRQMEPTDEAPQGKSIGETDLGNAALAAVPQAALDVLSLRMMPFIRGVFGQVGKDLSDEAARRIASKNLKDVAADYALATGKTMTVEGLTEAAQQSLERLQAGLTMTDEAARDEYLESFIGGAVLGGVLAPPGRYLERRAAQKEVPPETKPEPTATQPTAPTPITDEDELTPEEEADLQARIAAAPPPPAAGLPVAPTPTPPTPVAPQQVTASPEAVALPEAQQVTPQISPEAAPELEVLTTQLARIQQARMDPTLSPDDPAFLEFDQQEAAIQARIQQLTAPPAAVAPAQPLAPPVAPVVEPEVIPEEAVVEAPVVTPPPAQPITQPIPQEITPPAAPVITPISTPTIAAPPAAPAITEPPAVPVITTPPVVDVIEEPVARIKQDVQTELNRMRTSLKKAKTAVRKKLMPESEVTKLETRVAELEDELVEAKAGPRQVKYRSAKGNTWTGKGKSPPKWLRQKLAAGFELSDFEIRPELGNKSEVEVELEKPPGFGRPMPATRPPDEYERMAARLERAEVGGPNLFNELKGKLRDEDVIDIGRGKEFSFLRAGKGKGKFLVDLIDDGELNEFLPEAMQPESETYDASKSDEYLKKLLREDQSTDPEARITPEARDFLIPYLRFEISQLEAELEPEDVNQLIQEIVAEERAAIADIEASAIAEQERGPDVPGVTPDFALTGQTPEELAELQRKELSGEAEAERDRLEAEEAARAAAEAERKIADQKRETFDLAPPPSAPAVQAAGPVGDLFGTTGIREQPTRAPRRIGAEPSPIEAAIEESISKEVMGTPQEALDNLLQFLRIGSPTTNVTYDPNEKTILTENVYSGDTRIKRIEFDAITSLANKVDGRDGATYSILIKDTPTESVVFKFQPRGIKPLDRAVDIRYSLTEAKKDVNVPPIEEAIAGRMKELGVDDFEERSKTVQEFYGVSKPVADAYVRAKRKNAEEVAKWSYGLSTEAKFAESLKEVNKLLKRMEGISKRKEAKAEKKEEGFTISRDGIEGYEVDPSRVPNGNDAFQYVVGRVEAGRKAEVYRRRADERGTYGGWRVETSVDKLIPEKPSIRKTREVAEGTVVERIELPDNVEIRIVKIKNGYSVYQYDLDSDQKKFETIVVTRQQDQFRTPAFKNDQDAYRAAEAFASDLFDKVVPKMADEMQAAMKERLSRGEDVINNKTPDPDIPADQRLVLMACCATKKKGMGPAIDVYTGVFFQTLKNKVKEGAMPNLRILSAKYGFIAPDQKIEIYDQVMDKAAADKFMLDDKLVEGFPSNIKDVLIVGSDQYQRVMKAAIEDLIKAGKIDKGASINVTKGGIGEQRAQLGRYLASLPVKKEPEGKRAAKTPLAFYQQMIPDAGFKRLDLDDPRTYKNKSGEEFLTFERDGVRVAVKSNTQLYAADRGVGMYMGEDNDLLIQAMIVDESARRQGKATKALQDILSMADQAGMTSYIEPVQMTKDVGMTTEQLKDFYKRFGFKPQKTEPATDRVMVREPGAKIEIAPTKEKLKTTGMSITEIMAETEKVRQQLVEMGVDPDPTYRPKDTSKEEREAKEAKRRKELTRLAGESSRIDKLTKEPIIANADQRSAAERLARSVNGELLFLDGSRGLGIVFAKDREGNDAYLPIHAGKISRVDVISFTGLKSTDQAYLKRVRSELVRDAGVRQKRKDDDAAMEFMNIEAGPIESASQAASKRDNENKETLENLKSLRREKIALPEKVRNYGSTAEGQRIIASLNMTAQELDKNFSQQKYEGYTADNFMRQARKARDDGSISADVFAVIQAMHKDSPRLLAGLRLDIKQKFSPDEIAQRRNEGKKIPMGAFAPFERIVNLYTGTRGVIDPLTIRHEMTHTLEQMMTPAQRKAVINSYFSGMRKAVKKHKDAKSQEFFDNVIKYLNEPFPENREAMNKSLPSIDLYQFTSPSEYWAVNAEKLMAQRLGSAWDRFKKAVRKMFEKMNSIFGFDNNFVVHDVFDKIMSGSRDRMSTSMLMEFIKSDGQSYEFLENIEDDAKLVRRYNRTPTSQTDSAPLRRIMIGAAENSKDLFKSMVESPSEAINFMFNSVNRGVMFLRNKFIWFGSGINETDRIRYNGAVKTAEGLATASVALDNMIRGGNIATQVIMQGGIEFNKNTQMYGAAQKDKSMANVYRAEAKLKEKLGDQLGTDIEQGYLQAKRSRSIIDEVATREKAIPPLEAKEKETNAEIDRAASISKALDANPKTTAKQRQASDVALRKAFREHKKALRELQDAQEELKTIKRIREDKVTMSEQEIADFIQREEAHPELKEILDNFNAVNQNLLRFWRDVGLLSEPRYERLSSIKDYVPWYRVMDDDADIHDPVQATTRSATNIGKEKLFKHGKPSVVTDFTVEENQKVFRVQPGKVNAVKLGGVRLKPEQYSMTPNGELTLKVEAKPGQLLVVETQREIENMIDNMTRNVMRMTMNGLRQYAANRIVSEYATREAGKIKRFASADRNNGRFDYVENGRRTIVEIQDPLIAEAILGMETVGMKMWEPLAAAANFTRRTITLSPVFQLKQVFKDAPTAALVTGVKNPAALMGGVMRDFIGAVRDDDPVAAILRSQGIGGFYSPARTPEADVKRQIGIINNNTYDYVMKALDHFGDSSDMAQRIAIYKRVMAETGDETQALYQAANVINFLRHGSGQVAQALVKTVPFLNAYAQSIDVLYDALRGGGLRGKDRAAALQQLAITGSLLAGTTLIYTMLVGDDDDYMKMDDQSKIRSYMIPGTDVVLPMNTSAAFFFKAIPELIINKVINEGTETEVDAKRLRTAMKEAAVDLLLGPTPVPSAVKPIIEIGLDYNFFTSRPVTPRGMQSLDAYQQYNMRTSEAAKILSSLTGTDEKRVLNPMEADHLVRSIFGTAGAMVAWSSNLVGEAAEFRPEMGLKEMPVTGAFLRPEVPRGREDLFYKLKDDTDRKYRTYMTLADRDNQAEAQAYINRHPNLIAYYEYTSEMDAQLKEINSAIRFIGETRDPSYTPEIKRREIQEFLNLKQDILEGIEQFRKEAYSQ